MTELPDAIGRYHIERLLAHGGMGSVYLARDPAIDRLVAIKLLKAGFDDSAARERFAREARAAGRLHHPHIVTIFDVGEHDNRPFIAMEYVVGETLAQLIARRAVNRLLEKLAILEELCAGLHYAHSAGIVHRDIKPANVMCAHAGMVKILDFGIAWGGGAAITRAGDVMGTLNYMAPEQLAGDDVDHRADVYAVGVLAYELITGLMAFPGTVETGVLFRILNAAPVPIDSLMPGIDPDIIAIAQRAMMRHPDERYQDLRTMRQDLEAVRIRLMDSAPDLEQPIDPDAETRFDSSPVTSGSLRKPSSRAGSTPRHSSSPSGSGPSGQDSAPAPRRIGSVALLGMACGVLAGSLVWTVFLNRPVVIGPMAGSDSAALPGTPPSTPSPAPREVGSVGETGDGGERELSTARATARRQIVTGRHDLALDTAVRGLAVDDKDTELNALVDEMTGVARRTATESRAAAVARGANVRASSAFREGQAREFEAGTLLRGGDRVAGIRAAWTAAALYRKAAEEAGRNASAVPQVAPSAGPTGDRAESAAVKPESQPVSAPPYPEPLTTVPGHPVVKPASAPAPPPAAPKPEAATPARDPAADPRAADVGAVRETLRRYTQAYQDLDAAAVGLTMPSLTADQLRDLGRDLSSYRRYTVEIKEERIDVDGQTATVTCEVVRSFETKSGVAGNNRVLTTFHLRRSGSGWTIDRLASR